jgi:pimeloyl-ACP methyl ester carboxylesterase
VAEISSSGYRAGEGEPVVLLHGFTGHRRHWKPVLADLVARYEVIAPALSGHNGGPPYPSGIGLEKIADAGDALGRHLESLASAPTISSVTRWAAHSLSSSPSAGEHAA